jgi:hypothetical protein
VTIGPDLTHKQRQEEKNLREEVERKNREEITEDDVAKLGVDADGTKRCKENYQGCQQRGGGDRHRKRQTTCGEKEDGTTEQEDQRQ